MYYTDNTCVEQCVENLSNCLNSCFSEYLHSYVERLLERSARWCRGFPRLSHYLPAALKILSVVRLRYRSSNLTSVAPPHRRLRADSSPKQAFVGTYQTE